MSAYPRDVERRNSTNECNLPIGQMVVKLKGMPSFETISFYCTLPKLHTGGCLFEGKELVVTRRRP